VGPQGERRINLNAGAERETLPFSLRPSIDITEEV
jgi:hypothetical protein